jgi:hypothetical protein
MAPIHLQRRLWPRTACGKAGVLRSTQEWQWVDCPACLLRKPDDKGECKADVIVEARP